MYARARFEALALASPRCSFVDCFQDRTPRRLGRDHEAARVVHARARGRVGRVWACVPAERRGIPHQPGAARRDVTRLGAGFGQGESLLLAAVVAPACHCHDKRTRENRAEQTSSHA